MNYMFAFRETFSRPVRPIRFLGLFDTVNSVPQFENAWLHRSKFPYTARSTAKVIRHAVAIDERRAKFRQDLVSQERPERKEQHYRRRHRHWDKKHDEDMVPPDEAGPPPFRGRKTSKTAFLKEQATLAVPSTPSRRLDYRSPSPVVAPDDMDCGQSVVTDMSHDSMELMLRRDRDFWDGDESDDEEQDIQEVWFAGAHADIGGGWPLEAGEDTALSHIPLVWMVREAERAGLLFDPKKVRDLNCAEHVYQSRRKSTGVFTIPEIEVDSPIVDDLSGKDTEFVDGDDLMPPILDKKGHVKGPPIDKVNGQPMPTVGNVAHFTPDMTSEAEEARASLFIRALNFAATRGRIHDVLQFNNGATHLGVIAWNFMEYLPFRRMDLQPDGSWKSINWPLPKGETRDVPSNVVIHHTVIKRMQADPTYRPGNLIVGGGGRGVRVAPREYGIGQWKVLREEGDPVGECWVRDGPPGLLPSGRRRKSSDSSTLISTDTAVLGLPKRLSFREDQILLNELLRDLEDVIKLVMNLISFLFDYISRRMARQDKM